MLRFLVLPLLLAPALGTPQTPLKLDFVRSAAPHGLLSKRTLDVVIDNVLPVQTYHVNITVGTPPQSFSLLLDTASTDIWLPLANSTGCAPNCPPGSFDPTLSTTYNQTNVVFNATYGLTPDLQVVGKYFHDTLTVGDAVIPQMTLALANDPPGIFDAGDYGIFGLGSRFNEALFQNPSSPYFGQQNATYPTIYEELQSNGYIDRKAWGLWLNDEYAATGRVLFGAVDTCKYRGELVSTPASSSHGMFLGWGAKLTSISQTDSTGTISLTPSNYTLSVTIDSGAPSIYLPPELAMPILQHLNGTMYEGTPYVPCDARNTTDTLTFGLAGTAAGVAGPNVTVPYADLIYPFGLPSNVGNATAEDGTPLCYFTVIPNNQSSVFLLGDSFQRSTYLLFDVDNAQVAMAPVVYGSTTENIVPLDNSTTYPVGTGC